MVRFQVGSSLALVVFTAALSLSITAFARGKNLQEEPDSDSKNSLKLIPCQEQMAMLENVPGYALPAPAEIDLGGQFTILNGAECSNSISTKSISSPNGMSCQICVAPGNSGNREARLTFKGPKKIDAIQKGTDGGLTSTDLIFNTPEFGAFRLNCTPVTNADELCKGLTKIAGKGSKGITLKIKEIRERDASLQPRSGKGGKKTIVR